jgi:hypothetical protein
MIKPGQCLAQAAVTTALTFARAGDALRTSSCFLNASHLTLGSPPSAHMEMCHKNILIKLTAALLALSGLLFAAQAQSTAPARGPAQPA